MAAIDTGRELLGEERRELILRWLGNDGKVRASDLAPHAQDAAVPLGGRLEVGDVENEVVDALDGEGRPCGHRTMLKDRASIRETGGVVRVAVRA